MSRLKELYEKEIVPLLMKKYGLKNRLQVPRIVKVVINVGVGDAKTDAKTLEVVSSELAMITGQKPVITRARKSIAGFKLRKGMAIGCKVTLRRERMYEFMDRLFTCALPRVRDFRGVSPASFDGQGNYTLGIKEQIIFPEVDYEKVQKVRGMDITFVTSSESDDMARELLRVMGMPFSSQ